MTRDQHYGSATRLTPSFTQTESRIAREIYSVVGQTKPFDDLVQGNRLKYHRAARHVLGVLQGLGWVSPGTTESVHVKTKASSPVCLSARGHRRKYFPDLESAKGYLMYRVMDGRPLSDMNVSYLSEQEWQDLVSAQLRRLKE